MKVIIIICLALVAHYAFKLSSDTFSSGWLAGAIYGWLAKTVLDNENIPWTIK